jgi:hypothetical protein
MLISGYVPAMYLRRTVSLIMCLLLLQLQLGATARMCANAPSDDRAEVASTAAETHAHHDDGSAGNSHTDESSDMSHCALMTTCTVILAAHVDTRAAVASAAYQHAHPLPGIQPLSVSTAPDSPPPKI